MTELAAYGDLAHVRMGLQHVYFVNRADWIEQVLRNHYSSFLKGRGVGKRRLLGQGIITSEGEAHRGQRRRLQPAFHRERIESYGEIMARCAAACAERWREGQTVDILSEMRRLMVTIVGKAMLSFESEEEISSLDDAIESALNEFRAFKPFGRLTDSLPLPSTRRARAADARLEGELRRMIVRRRAKGGRDLVSMLLEARGADPAERLEDHTEVLEEAVTIFLAGYETNATAMMWCWHLLATHPDVEAELHAELDRVLGGRDPVLDDVSQLVYTERVYFEALRLFPPVWRLLRTAIRDVPLGEYVVPAGSLVLVSQFVTQRDPRYFPDPERFDPQRWTPEAVAARPRYSFFPFGGGVRRCLAESFAFMEGVLALATLARRWRLRLPSRVPLEFAPIGLLRPLERLTMVVERRAPAEATAQAS